MMNERKRKVIEVAQQLFTEKGFNSTSIQDILEASKISKGTFYNYFSSKNECLIAILENGREETAIRRQELLAGKDPADKDILANQISVRQQVNMDLNLMPIFEAILHSGDAELREFAKKYHLAELSWLSNRFVDIYGVESAPYATDCAVMTIGIIHHMVHVWTTANLVENIDTNELSQFALRRIDSMIPSMIEKNDNLLSSITFADIGTLSAFNREQLIKELVQFKQKVLPEYQEAKQYIDFITEEISSEQPRVVLLETITRSFRQSFMKTPYDFESRELAASIWAYLETLK